MLGLWKQSTALCARFCRGRHCGRETVVEDAWVREDIAAALGEL